MYEGVPTKTPDAVRTVASWRHFTTPKSVTFGTGPSRELPSRMLAGLRSRWISPSACAAATPDAMPRKRWSTCANDSRIAPSTAARSGPSTNSITRP